MSTKYKAKTQANKQQAKGQAQRKATQAPPKSPVDDAVVAERAARKEEQRAARIERQAAAYAAAQRRKRMAKIRRNGIIAGVVIVLAALIALYYVNEANKPGQLVPMQPSPHLASIDSPHAPYNTSPPTSGPHTKDVPPGGVHTEPVRPEEVVHFLEDKGVVINYRPDLDKATVDRLASLVETYPSEVMLAPYEDLSHPVVLTAWRRIDRLDAFDEARIQRFIQAYRGIDHHGESGT